MLLSALPGCKSSDSCCKTYGRYLGGPFLQAKSQWCPFASNSWFDTLRLLWQRLKIRLKHLPFSCWSLAREDSEMPCHVSLIFSDHPPASLGVVALLQAWTQTSLWWDQREPFGSYQVLSPWPRSLAPNLGGANHVGVHHITWKEWGAPQTPTTERCGYGACYW